MCVCVGGGSFKLTISFYQLVNFRLAGPTIPTATCLNDVCKTNFNFSYTSTGLLVSSIVHERSEVIHLKRIVDFCLLQAQKSKLKI